MSLDVIAALEKAWSDIEKLKAENRYLRERLDMASDGAYLMLRGTGILPAQHLA